MGRSTNLLWEWMGWTGLGLSGVILTGAVFGSGCRVGAFFARNVAALGEPMTAVPNKITNANRPDARLAVSWVGHATVLVQMDDKFILTDPVFTRTVGQISTRLVEPGIAPEDLPPIDLVVISHMHFDHLSLGSLSLIERKVRALAMPSGGLVYLTDFGFPAFDLERWETRAQDGLAVTAVPVRHIGWRYAFDAAWMKRSYTGYVIEYHGMRVYFGGDTAFDGDLFAQTAHRFPDIDVALLPIGPVEPRDFMKRLHMDPQEALDAFHLLRARQMVPIHHGTFVNSMDRPGDPLQVLQREIGKRCLSEGQVVVLNVGEQRVLRSHPTHGTLIRKGITVETTGARTFDPMEGNEADD